MNGEAAFILIRCKKLFDYGFGSFCHRTYHPTRMSILKYMKLSMQKLHKLKKFEDEKIVKQFYKNLADVSMVETAPNYVFEEPYVKD